MICAEIERRADIPYESGNFITGRASKTRHRDASQYSNLFDGYCVGARMGVKNFRQTDMGPDPNMVRTLSEARRKRGFRIAA